MFLCNKYREVLTSSMRPITSFFKYFASVWCTVPMYYKVGITTLQYMLSHRHPKRNKNISIGRERRKNHCVMKIYNRQAEELVSLLGRLKRERERENERDVLFFYRRECDLQSSNDHFSSICHPFQATLIGLVYRLKQIKYQLY